MADPTQPLPDDDPDRTLAVGRATALHASATAAGSAAQPATASPAAAAPQASSNVLPAGTVVGEFEVTGVIGEGGFGIVYRARDRALQRTVALKEYMPSALAARLADTRVVVKSEQHRETFEVGLKSFINEARLLAAFDHPALVKVYRFWAANGTAYMAMPLYEGGTLKQALKAMPQPPDEAWLRALLAPLLDAVDLLHRSDCLHRDIAPDNILLVGAPLAPVPLLLDFGAARRVIGGQTQALTVILKPGYAPIEQYDEIPGMKQGPWTDLYALGAVMHFAISGKPPPVSVGRLVHDSYQPLRTAAAGRYGDAFLAAVDAMLAARPEQRPQGVAQLRALLALSTAAASAAPAPTVTGATAGAPARSAVIVAGTVAATTSPAITAARATPASEPRTSAPASPRRPVRWARAAFAGAAAGALLLGATWGALTWTAARQQRALEQAARDLAAPPAAAKATARDPGAGTAAGAQPALPATSARPGSPAAASPSAAVPAPAQQAAAGSTSAGPVGGTPPPAAAAPSSTASTAAAAPAAPARRPPAAGAPPPVAVNTSVATDGRKAAAGASLDSALREARDCLAARQYACTIARAESVLQAEPGHAAAKALLAEARSAQEAALGSDWKMR